MAALIATGPCVVHDGIFSFDPDRVTTIVWDPVTGNPPDVDPVTGLLVDPPDPVRQARSYKAQICPPCCKRLNDWLRADGQAPKFDETDTSKAQQ